MRPSVRTIFIGHLDATGKPRVVQVRRTFQEWHGAMKSIAASGLALALAATTLPAWADAKADEGDIKCLALGVPVHGSAEYGREDNPDQQVQRMMTVYHYGRLQSRGDHPELANAMAAQIVATTSPEQLAREATTCLNGLEPMRKNMEQILRDLHARTDPSRP